jgi:MYXO-CTERM domain-containing protein
MDRVRFAICAALAASVLASSRVSLAADGICNEAPAATIDGIPAYSMCTAAETSDVYSDDGVHTAGTASGPNWVQTAYGNGYQCTELAGRYLNFVWNVSPDWIQGDAKDICTLSLPSTLELSTTPMHGDLAVFPPNCDGASSVTGHVAVVDSVSGSKITVVQQNFAGSEEDDSSCIACYVHVLANTGTVGDAGPSGEDAGEGDAAVIQDAAADATVVDSGAPEPGDASALAHADAASINPDAATSPLWDSGGGSIDIGGESESAGAFGTGGSSAGCACSQGGGARASSNAAVGVGVLVFMLAFARRRRGAGLTP